MKHAGDRLNKIRDGDGPAKVLIFCHVLLKRFDCLKRTWVTKGGLVTGLGDDNAFSYLCVRGNDTIYVWSANEKSSLHSVMLVRTQGDAELAAKQ